MVSAPEETSRRPRTTKPASPLSPCAAQEWHQPVFRPCGTSEGSKPTPAACTLSTEHVLRSWTERRPTPTARATHRRAADQNRDRCSALQNRWGEPPRCVGCNAFPHQRQHVGPSAVIATGHLAVARAEPAPSPVGPAIFEFPAHDQSSGYARAVPERPCPFASA
jgi:hypothetical protein